MIKRAIFLGVGHNFVCVANYLYIKFRNKVSTYCVISYHQTIAEIDPNSVYSMKLYYIVRINCLILVFLLFFFWSELCCCYYYSLLTNQFSIKYCYLKNQQNAQSFTLELYHLIESTSLPLDIYTTTYSFIHSLTHSIKSVANYFLIDN